MDAGMMEYRIIPTDLKRVTDISINKVQLLADAKHVQLILEAPSQRVWVRADALRIEQVLDNLLSNALKFSSEGGIVKVVMKADQKAGVLEVSVIDAGPGKPKICLTFSNASIREVPRLNTLRREAGLA
jgi:two-component system sensor histidine kinase GlrK